LVQSGFSPHTTAASCFLLALNARLQPFKQTTMMNVNPKYVRGQPMLTVDQLREASQYCVDLHKYYI
jgi:hypothetical protein